jgi:hypothetical protein
MKGIFWNNNGLQDQPKPRFLFDSAKEYQLDFLAIMETRDQICANKNCVGLEAG